MPTKPVLDYGKVPSEPSRQLATVARVICWSWLLVLLALVAVVLYHRDVALLLSVALPAALLGIPVSLGARTCGNRVAANWLLAVCAIVLAVLLLAVLVLFISLPLGFRRPASGGAP